jgi:signal transduction histidine kinase
VAPTATERLLRRTRRRLFLTTFALLTLLVVGVGSATAVLATSALDADVDRALDTAVRAQIAAMGDELPSGDGEQETESPDQPPAVASTALLVLDARGKVVLNRTGVATPGLPDPAAVAAARASGLDLRTVAIAGGDARVLTRALTSGGAVTGFVQGAFSLELHDRQSQSLVVAILAVAALGLIAAVAIAYVLTDRALAPIRAGFEAQRRFVADASHELRTPAALIRANAEVLQREGLVADDGQELLDDVITESDRLGGLVGDLLQLAAWDETTLVLSKGPMDLSEVGGVTVRGARAFAASREVALELVAPSPVPVVADRARVAQLLLVLLDNAVDHAPPGTVVRVGVGRAGAEAELTVDDAGPGIAEADRERIFEPFTRLPRSAHHRSGGTGLGLAIARRIAEAHGGRVWAGEPPGGGARFTVRLPADGDRRADVGMHSTPTR